MDLNKLKKFAQGARRTLLSEVASRLDYVMGHDDIYVRSHQVELAEIRRQLDAKGREQLVEEVAYTWFNRIVALRYMDLRGYNKVRVVSPQAGQVQPELLFQIKQGRTPPEIRSLQDAFDGYLSGTLGSTQPDREIYTAALLGICNEYSRTLPFLFRKVDEYMAVLLPTDLLSESSILAAVQGAIGEEDVTDVEVIGWLYQFYISEKKDQVFGRPRGEKIKKEDIPAATQLFTPHWIVRYMVENSLGRLWRNNRPDTGLADQMEYYIKGDPEPEYLTIEGPEEITLLDPACGSGHILTYAFDLLYGMYEEVGYSAEEIPSLILTNNLYGIDIDTRAAELASFALTMKAREKDRFFFQCGVVPQVLAMEDVTVDPKEAGITMSPQLQEAFGYLTEATNFGSLIPVPAEVQGEIEELLAQLDAKGDEDLFADLAMGQVRSGLLQLGYLARRYHCVVTNPPYMDRAKANERLSGVLRNLYFPGDHNLYTSFVLRAKQIGFNGCYFGFVTLENWMYGERFTGFRRFFLRETRIISLLHLESSIMRIAFGTSAFIFAGDKFNASVWITPVASDQVSNSRLPPTVFREMAKTIIDRNRILSFPYAVFAYGLPASVREMLDSHNLSEVLTTREGLTTGDNDSFLRLWHEVSEKSIAWEGDRDNHKRWFLYVKGGDRRLWYGNWDFVVDWENDGERVRGNREAKTGRVRSHNYNGKYAFRPGICWSGLTNGSPSFRYCPGYQMFDTKGPMGFVSADSAAVTPESRLLAFLNSKVASYVLSSISPTMDYKLRHIESLPVPPQPLARFSPQAANDCLSLSATEWHSHETSWGFRRSPLLNDHTAKSTKIGVDDNLSFFSWARSQPSEARFLEDAYSSYVECWSMMLTKLKTSQEQNNAQFIDMYDLQDILRPEIEYSELTFLKDEVTFSGPHSDKISFRKDEILKQFVSWGVGCIFGRYSLDKDGLILANAGDDLDPYLTQIPEPTFRPDESGLLPITDDNDFSDDLPSQWRAFLRAAFGNEHYEENLRFLEDGLGKRLRSYFLKGFYNDHVKRYKKRPIYWLIASPKGSLRALIYQHRYNRDTVNRFLNDYLRPYQQKLEAKRVSAEHVLTGGGSTQSEKTMAQKRIDEIRKALEELSTWERDVVRPLAEKRIELDLDDGVKVNYGKLGAILAKVKGLNG